jgi:hypothetical protein
MPKTGSPLAKGELRSGVALTWAWPPATCHLLLAFWTPEVPLLKSSGGKEFLLY